LAFLQAEVSACGLGLANVPNVRWHFLVQSFICCMVFFSMKHNGYIYEMLGLRCASLSAVTKADAGQKLSRKHQTPIFYI